MKADSGCLFNYLLILIIMKTLLTPIFGHSSFLFVVGYMHRGWLASSEREKNESDNGRLQEGQGECTVSEE